MTEITLDAARAIIEGTFAKGAELGLRPLSAVVLDGGGHVRAFERQDGASPGRFAIAHGKAFGAVMLGMTGSEQMARAEQQAYFMGAINGLFSGQVVPVPGGLLVRDAEGRVIGAVGVTGDTSERDAEAGLAGITRAGLDGAA